MEKKFSEIFKELIDCVVNKLKTYFIEKKDFKFNGQLQTKFSYHLYWISTKIKELFSQYKNTNSFQNEHIGLSSQIQQHSHLQQIKLVAMPDFKFINSSLNVILVTLISVLLVDFYMIFKLIRINNSYNRYNNYTKGFFSNTLSAMQFDEMLPIIQLGVIIVLSISVILGIKIIMGLGYAFLNNQQNILNNSIINNEK